MAQTLPHSKKRSAVADYEDDNNNSPYREPANKRMCSTWIAAEESNESISIDSTHEDAMPRLSPLHSSCIEGSALRGVNNRHFYDEAGFFPLLFVLSILTILMYRTRCLKVLQI